MMLKEQFINQVLPLRPHLLDYARSYVKEREESEDIVQEVFLKLYEMREQLDRYQSIEALSVTITKRLCLNRIRDSKGHLRSEYDANTPGRDHPPGYALEQKDALEHVVRIIDRLPTLQQSVIKMKHIDGMSVDEIAEITGSSTDAIRMHLSRGRKQIINYFTQLEK